MSTIIISTVCQGHITYMYTTAQLVCLCQKCVSICQDDAVHVYTIKNEFFARVKGGVTSRKALQQHHHRLQLYTQVVIIAVTRQQYKATDMVTKKCCICGSKNHVHSWPRNTDLYNKWMKFFNEHKPSSTIGKSSGICYRHFEREDFSNWDAWACNRSQKHKTK